MKLVVSLLVGLLGCGDDPARFDVGGTIDGASPVVAASEHRVVYGLSGQDTGKPATLFELDGDRWIERGEIARGFNTESVAIDGGQVAAGNLTTVDFDGPRNPLPVGAVTWNDLDARTVTSFTTPEEDDFGFGVDVAFAGSSLVVLSSSALSIFERGARDPELRQRIDLPDDDSRRIRRVAATTAAIAASSGDSVALAELEGSEWVRTQTFPTGRYPAISDGLLAVSDYETTTTVYRRGDDSWIEVAALSFGGLIDLDGDVLAIARGDTIRVFRIEGDELVEIAERVEPVRWRSVGVSGDVLAAVAAIENGSGSEFELVISSIQ